MKLCRALRKHRTSDAVCEGLQKADVIREFSQLREGGIKDNFTFTREAVLESLRTSLSLEQAEPKNSRRHDPSEVEKFVDFVSTTSEFWVDAKYLKPVWPSDDASTRILHRRGGRGRSKEKPKVKPVAYEPFLVKPPGRLLQVSSWGRYRRFIARQDVWSEPKVFSGDMQIGFHSTVGKFARSLQPFFSHLVSPLTCLLLVP